MLVYFAHPIDQAGLGSHHTNHIGRTLRGVGVSAFRPGWAFTVAGGSLSDLSAVQRINEAALDTSDALVAWLPGGVPTLGVPAEIESALSQGLPTLILTDGDLMYKSVQLNAWRDAGATVELWNDRLARSWEASPEKLIALLVGKPVRELRDITGFNSLVPGRAVSGSELLVRYDHPERPTLVPGKYEGDAGIDLAIKETAMFDPGEYKLVPTGAHVAIPDGYFGLITGRSSTWAKHRCQVVQAVIDSGYRGELMVGLTNYNSDRIVFEGGMRLAQIILLPTFGGGLRQVDRLPESHRGKAGYGSSGA
jgi:dUTP pyrophosphatase